MYALVLCYCYLRNELQFWPVHGIMKMGLTLTLQETDVFMIPVNRPKIEIISYI